MDKLQASAIANALLQDAKRRRTLPARTSGPHHLWSHKEWLLVILVAFLWLCFVVGIAFAYGLTLGSIVIVGELAGPFGFLVGFLVIAWRRVLTRHSSGPRSRSAA